MKHRIFTAAAVFVLGASVALAQPFQGDGGEGHGRMHHRHAQAEKMMQKLNLSDAQKSQLRDLHQSFRAENKAFFESFRENMRAFHEAKRAGDTATMDTLKPTLDSQRDQAKQLHDALDQRMSSVLTADQLAQWNQMKADRQARRQQREQQR